MPHKHTRKGDLEKSTIDLPPTTIAEPLPVSKSAKTNGIFTSEINAKRNIKKRKRNADKADDTPKAFLRLMAFQQGKKLPKGLDDGVKETKAAKKRSIAAAEGKEDGNVGQAVSETPAAEIPRINPGERMSEFAARVDAALPVSGLINNSAKGGKDPLGLKVGRTKTEKKMHRMYDEWREQDRKIKEKRLEALELAEEEEMDQEGGVKWKIDMQDESSRHKKGKAKKKVLGEVDDGEDDPWAVIKKRRGEEKAGLNDVVQGPPTFTRVPKEKFKVRGALIEVEGVPKASGSLRRREELGEVRRSVVEGYRQMMKENRAKAR